MSWERVSKSFALFAAALILFWPHPITEVSDSRIYLYAADSFLAGHGFRVDPAYPMWGDVMTQYPPGYPLTLAAFRWLQIDPLTGVRLLSAVCYGLTVYLVLSHALRYRFAAGLSLLMFFPAYLYMLTEPPFILALVALVIDLPKGKPSRLSILLTIAYLYRYSGMFLLIFAVAWLLIYRGWQIAFKACFLPVAVIAAWALRNWLLISKPMGLRLPPSAEPAQAVASWLFTLGLFILIIGGLVMLQWIVTSLARRFSHWRRSMPLASWLPASRQK